MAAIVSDIDGSRSATVGKAVIFVVWFALASTLCWSEVVWRDEVRALSFALQGENLLGMLRQVRGDGHPALWHILLRAGYSIGGSPIILKILALTIATISSYLLVFRLELPLPMMLLALFGNFSIFEYAAMSRNYGISMLFVFLIAVSWEKGKSNGILLGLLFALLANTNVHSVILIGGFFACWFFELVQQRQGSTSTDRRAFAASVAIATVGVILCILTVYPTFNDAAAIDLDGQNLVSLALGDIVAPGSNFMAFYPAFVLDLMRAHPTLYGIFVSLMSVLLYGSLLGLANRLPAMIASGLVLLGLCLLFTFVYPGGYRHQALWLVFTIAITALTSSSPLRTSGVAGNDAASRIARIGQLCFLILLSLQVISGFEKIYQTVITDTPLSRSKDFGAFMQSRPDLRDAIVIADPDYLVEPLPYYISNRTYLMREQRFGNTVRFTRNARLSLSLADILQTASHLRQSEGVPVVILLSQRLDQVAAPTSVLESYVWELSFTPENIFAFQDATSLLKRFGPTAGSDETFDAYLLK
ncbi:hypothetical protein [Rhizobium sp. BK529]|uniref:hypothetical protein n=1 Tax=Rhizobium sp. BK529 TaxID=2586983 RepID=UPI001620F299|nr:hypothetical protein [Rhizobium sp. BK529]